jgi:hypothetical protein
MWPTAYALKELTIADEAKIAALVKKAASYSSTTTVTSQKAYDLAKQIRLTPLRQR